jgi:hypothetical protein
MSLPSVITTKTIGAGTERVLLRRYGNGMIEFIPQLVTNVTTTSGSAVLTAAVSTNGLRAGMAISGTGIPAGATVVSFVANTSITISTNATASGTGRSMTIAKVPARGPFRSGERDFTRQLFDALAATN